jgi:hypothetical protein
MIRKITKNNHQFKISLPIDLIRKMNWDDSTSIKFKEVETPMGKGLLILKENNEVMRIDLK